MQRGFFHIIGESSVRFEVFVVLCLDHKGQCAIGFVLGNVAKDGLGDEQVAERLVIVPQLDRSFRSCCKLFSACSDRSLLYLEPFDRGILLCDRIRAGLDVFEHDLEQEAVLGVSCHFVAFKFSEVFEAKFSLIFDPLCLCCSFFFRDLQVVSGRRVLYSKGESALRFFLCNAASNRLGKGNLPSFFNSFFFIFINIFQRQG